MKKISVILCTKNRARHLENTLRSFEQLDYSKNNYEIILVDNGSTDRTKEVSENFNGILPIRYVYEKKPGLAAARNTGLSCSQGNIVAFTDDDVEVTSDWLSKIEVEFNNNPEIKGLFGKGELPEGVPISFGKRTAVRRYFGSPWQLWFVGSGFNMAFRKDLFDKIGVFDERFGAGTAFRSGEDGDLIYRALKKGYKIVYCPEVRIRHLPLENRSSFRAALDYDYGGAALLAKYLYAWDPWVIFHYGYRLLICLNLSTLRDNLKKRQIVEFFLEIGRSIFRVVYFIIWSVRMLFHPDIANKKLKIRERV